MRLGELRNIVDQATSNDNTLVYNTENLYEGKRFRVTSYSELWHALHELSKQEWGKADAAVLKELEKQYGTSASAIEISPEQHNRLNDLVNDINRSLPVFYGIIDTVVDEQDEQIVNVKLPVESIADLSELNKFNKELQEVFNLIVKYKGLNGDIKFNGIDIGTSWYKILIVGCPLVYSAFMGSIDIARELIQLRKEWYESEDIRIEVEIKEKITADQITGKQIEAYINEKITKKLEKKVKGLIHELPSEETQQNQEMETSISKGIQKAIKLIEQGTEFHPSLNPPEYIEEDKQGIYHIDYDQVRRLIEEKRKQEAQPKQVEHKPSQRDGDDDAA
jgi:hypothetical protein